MRKKLSTEKNAFATNKNRNENPVLSSALIICNQCLSLNDCS